MEKVFIAIDLKTFYASVECVERKLDPLKTNLVVADASRTTKTICLAVSTPLKAYGIGGRARLFEVVRAVEKINEDRKAKINGRRFRGKSYFSEELAKDPYLELDYIVATPRMQYYMDYSARIFEIYLKYFAPEDIHSYSVDEVFIDASSYRSIYNMSPFDLTRMIIKDIYDTTGITATAGIGTNLYLAKVAMDIVAKHLEADEYGVRIAQLDERAYKEKLWDYQPITDFWMIGSGYRNRLASIGLYTMGDVARQAIENEDKLFKLFGINAELLIDHAFGIETTRMKDIKSYTPSAHSLSQGQVLERPYELKQARIVLSEMADALALDMFSKGLVSDKLVVDIGYDIESVNEFYKGEVTIDRYGRKTPKHSHGTVTLIQATNLGKYYIDAATSLFDAIARPGLKVRRLNIAAIEILPEGKARMDFQLDLLTDSAEVEDFEKEKDKERKVQQAVLNIKNKYGKNAIVKGISFEEGATALKRNKQIGGHKA